jgi:uncharacterized protein YqhQ
VAQKVGGQAVFEGVMLRGDTRWAVAVRTRAGHIDVHSGSVPTWGLRWKGVPVLRGLIAVAHAVPVGARAFRWSMSKGLRPAPRRSTSVLRIAGLLIALLLVPPVMTDWLLGGLRNGWVSGVFENVLAVGVLVGYAAAVGRLAMLRTLFEYHGAEHKVVAAHEAAVALTPEAAARFSTRHVRCGTSLLLVVAVVAAVFSMLQLPAVVVFPLVAGLAAELQLRAAANVHRPWVRALLRPGLALQGLTTREPSAAQLEVAIIALQAVIDSAAQPSSVEAVAVPA